MGFIERKLAACKTLAEIKKLPILPYAVEQ